MNKRVIIVVPCYNEAKRLDTDAFRDYCVQAGDVGFVFVNDGSTDTTKAILDKFQEETTMSAGVCHLEANSGKAEAIRQGCLRALSFKPEFVGYWDADLATPLSDINVFFQTLVKHTELKMVMGARVAMLGRVIERKLFRHYIGRIIGTVISMILGVNVYDTQCGAKLFRVTAQTKTLFDAPFSAGWLFDVEVLQRLKMAGLDLDTSVYEYPLMVWHDIAGSKVKLSDFPKILVALWRLYRMR